MLQALVLVLLVVLGGAAKTVSSKAVFAHVVVGITASYDQAKWAQEISDAKASGIEAFALNIGKDSYTETQLGFAYAAAQADGNFKIFISFDFSYYSLPQDADLIVQTINNRASSPAQYQINGKALVTTFSGDGQDWSGVKSRTNIFLVPNWSNENTVAQNPQIDGGYPWNAWGTMNNRGVANPSQNLINQDNSWRSTLGNKVYFAPISPWFFTHYAPNSFNKNWIFPTEDLFLTRWQRILDISPFAIYQLTWNDYSESTYIAPLRNDPNLYPAGASAWTSNMPHDGFRLIQNAYVTAYKAGATSQFVSDTLFITTLLTSPAQLVVGSGGTSSSFNVGSGAVMTKVPIQAGQQTLTLTRNGATVLSGTSPESFSTGCPSNVYNFNAYVGVL